MEKGTILYFGTTCKGSGHGATLLKGSFDSRKEMSDIERWIDGLSDRDDLQQFWPSRRTFATINFDRGTWFGVNLSPHDERGGSKTVLYVDGLHLSEQQMVKLVNEHPFARRMFAAVCEKYKLTMPPMMLSGAEEISNERSRQIVREGYDASHDREHATREFVLASVAYMLSSIGEEGEARKYWPWDEQSFKPKDLKSDIIRGGALAAAAIDRKNMDIHK